LCTTTHKLFIRMTPKAAHVTQLRLMALDPVHIKKKAQRTRERGSSNFFRSLKVEVRNLIIRLLVNLHRLTKEDTRNRSILF